MNEKYSFDGIRSGENVQLIVRSHPIQLVWPVTKALFVIIIAVILYTYFSLINYWVYADAALLFIGFVWLFEAFFCLKGTLTIITNQRVVMRRQQGFFRRGISEVELSNIQELSAITKGLINNLFGNGSVLIKTAAGEKSVLEIKNVPDPYLVQQKISELIAK